MNPGAANEQSTVLGVGTVTVGRTNDNQIVCMHKSLSRRHAEIAYDGKHVRVLDLQSKNGIFHKGMRVPSCVLSEGDTFRCGDISFLLEGATSKSPKLAVGVQTLPSPLAALGGIAEGGGRFSEPAVSDFDEGRYKDKLFLLIRATELLVGQVPLDRTLDELVVLAVQILEVDRIALLALSERSLSIEPKVVKTFVGGSTHPYSTRVVDWVVDNGSATSFADVSSDTTLPGDRKADAAIRSAMAVPINTGGGTIGVLYADSVSRADAFKPDDLAVFRALANIAAVAMDSHALRRVSPQG